MFTVKEHLPVYCISSLSKCASKAENAKIYSSDQIIKKFEIWKIKVFFLSKFII